MEATKFNAKTSEPRFKPLPAGEVSVVNYLAGTTAPHIGTFIKPKATSTRRDDAELVRCKKCDVPMPRRTGAGLKAGSFTSVLCAMCQSR